MFAILLNQLWQILNVIGEFFIDVNGQILKNNPPSGHTVQIPGQTFYNFSIWWKSRFPAKSCFRTLAFVRGREDESRSRFFFVEIDWRQIFSFSRLRIQSFKCTRATFLTRVSEMSTLQFERQMTT